MKPLIEGIRPYLELCKPRIALFAAFSSASGFLLAHAASRNKLFLIVAGVLVLSSGAGALNQYLERRTDALMPRTESRPVPSGRLSPLRAFCFSLSLIFSGLFILLLTGNKMATLLGLSAVLWYNGLYTYLKTKTAFAAVPGALIGAVPPAMGWVAAGGSLYDPGLLYVCFFFFLWQVPHFWLLILRYGEEYRSAGLPSMTGILTEPQIARIIFSWIFATAVSCLFFVSNALSLSPFIRSFLFGVSLWLVWNGIRLLRARGKGNEYAFAFKRVNAYMLLVMILLSVDKL